MSGIISGFPSIARKDASVLILGSMPSAESLRQQQYYAHPRNAFWPVMMSLLGADPELDYQHRSMVLIENRIAVWDTLKTCIRPGSLDTAIVNASVEVNDFNLFFLQHISIQYVFFNGRKSEQLFRRYAMKTLPEQDRTLEYHVLPSTSPAMASLTRQEKTDRWRLLIEKLSAC